MIHSHSWRGVFRWNRNGHIRVPLEWRRSKLTLSLGHQLSADLFVSLPVSYGQNTLMHVFFSPTNQTTHRLYVESQWTKTFARYLRQKQHSYQVVVEVCDLVVPFVIPMFVDTLCLPRRVNNDTSTWLYFVCFSPTNLNITLSLKCRIELFTNATTSYQVVVEVGDLVVIEATFVDPLFDDTLWSPRLVNDEVNLHLLACLHNVSAAHFHWNVEFALLSALVRFAAYRFPRHNGVDGVFAAGQRTCQTERNAFGVRYFHRTVSWMGYLLQDQRTCRDEQDVVGRTVITSCVAVAVTVPRENIWNKCEFTETKR